MDILSFFTYDFFIRAIVSGILIGGILSFLSPLIVMKSQVIYGHSISHFALLGVILSFLFNIPTMLGIIVFCFIAGIIITLIQGKNFFRNDSILEIIAQIGLAISIVWISFLDSYQIDLEQFLFGDILAVSKSDLIYITTLTIFLIVLISIFFKDILKLSISDILSRISVKKHLQKTFITNLIFAFSIAIGIKALGILLVSSFITIPANIAKLYAKSIKASFILSTIMGLISVFSGLLISALFNTPSGPTIVLTLAGIWVLSVSIKKTRL